ncbi:leucine-rich repeat domain-containing protein [Segatella copri]|nr:leucine-rich repeat domain-containing protein [Segatella copri]
MRNFTLRKGFLESKCGTRSSFKGFVMLVVMMLMMASSAMAEDVKFEVIDGFRYFLDTGAKTAALMSKTDGNYSGDIIIPEKVKGNDGVECVVTSLGDECFKDCSGLTSITIPSSVTSLGDDCFTSCIGLTSITIPSSVTSLGDDCFSYCSSLTSIEIPSSVTSLGDYCFSGCSNLTSITIPSSVTFLGDDCFSGCSGLETVYFKGNVPTFYYNSKPDIPTTTIIKVPTEYLQDYKDALGSSYKYIYGWNPDGTGDDTKPVTPCAAPSISYASGELKFTCETAGAEYHYTITDADMASNAYNKEGKVTLSAAYYISVYATADGYKASDKTEATLYWINANLDNGTNINQVRTRGVVASAHDGIISLSGLDDGEVVKFFAADGKYLGFTVAANGAASYAVNESLVIAKVGKDSIKIAMK